MKYQTSQYSRYFTYIKPLTRIPIVKTYGSTIFTIIVVLIFIFFAIKPTVETILVLQKKLNDAEAILQKVTQKANDLSEGKQNYDNLDPAIKNGIQSSIPDSIAVRNLIQTLDQLTLTNQASISALQIQPFTLQSDVNTQIGTLTEMQFTLNVEAVYAGIISFLQALQDSSRLITINTLSINKAAEGSNLIMSVSGKAYYLK